MLVEHCICGCSFVCSLLLSLLQIVTGHRCCMLPLGIVQQLQSVDFSLFDAATAGCWPSDKGGVVCICDALV